VAGKAQDELPVGNDPEFDDLRQWRISQGLSPQPAVAILTRSMDLPWERICGHADRQVLVITTGQNHQQQSAAATDSGATVVRLGDADYVSGVDLVRFLIAGPMVLETLLRDQVLNRLFMTRVHRIIGGVEFDTILESKRLQPPANMRLVSLYLHQAEAIEQCFACYDLQGVDG
jgi:riboflavin biosynthesis pyrimidine reductase